MLEATFHDVVLSVLCGLMGMGLPSLWEVQSKLRDLHDWHKPDDRGRQRWRDTHTKIGLRK